MTSWVSALAVAVATFLFIADTQARSTATADIGASDRVIITFLAVPDASTSGLASPKSQTPSDPSALRAKLEALGKRTGAPLKLARSVSALVHAGHLGRAMWGADLQRAIDRIAADPSVASVVVDRHKHVAAVPTDPRYGFGPQTQQWYLPTPDASFPAAIDAQRAWDLTLGSSAIAVAVIDTGVLLGHPDLAGKVLPGYDMIEGESGNTFLVANDGNGRDADASDPGDWVNQADVDAHPDVFTVKNCFDVVNGVSVPADSSWHGTHIAGLIGAVAGNGIGGVGIGWNTPILPVRVLGKCGGYDSDVLAGMNWAGGIEVPGIAPPPLPARVINLSLGSSGTPCSDAYRSVISALRARNVVVVAAAGNEGASPGEPANCPGVISVAALRQNGEKVGFSNFGSDVTLSAPGGNCGSGSGPCQYPIVSTENTSSTTPDINGYTYGGKLGTSFSAPMVAGVAALMLSVNPSLSPDEVAQRLSASSRAFPVTGTAVCTPTTAGQGPCACTTALCGAGMLDAFAAVQAALGPVSIPTPAPAPTPPANPAPTPASTATGTSGGDGGGGGAVGGLLSLVLLVVLATRRRTA